MNNSVPLTCERVPGVLRGIDMERGLYFLLTPVGPSVLRKVNCLLLGAISLPSCVLTTQVRRQTLLPFKIELRRLFSSGLTLPSSLFQSGFEGGMPYVTTDYSFDLSGAGKLRVFKGLTRPGQIGIQ